MDTQIITMMNKLPSTRHLPRRPSLFVILAAVTIGILLAPGTTVADPLEEAIRDTGANVIFLRHALAPGTGDPVNFDIQSCDTQRNLSANGRDQARRLGAYFQNLNIQPDTVLSSAWCRCQDTATEMGLGPHTVFAGLNSFFDGHVDREETLALLRERLAEIDEDRLVLMVTHQVVITAVTGIFPPSGGVITYNSRTGKATAIGAPVRP